MKFCIKSESGGRMRIHAVQKRMTYEQADILEYTLQKFGGVASVKVYDRTCDAVIYYTCSRNSMIEFLREFSYAGVDVPDTVVANSGRAMNAEYQEQLVGKIMYHYARKWLLPAPLRACYTIASSLKFIAEGIKCLWNRKIEVPVLDATAIGVSIVRGDFDTAGSVMFLLGIGELLEEWTHKKSVGNLARSMSLNIGKEIGRAHV